MSIASRINEMTEHLRNDWDSIDKLGLDITEENSNDNLDKNIENIAPVLNRFYNKSSDKTDLSENGIVGRTSQNTAILPSEYTQVDYIESSGAQYIDTGHYPSSNNDELEIQASYVGGNTTSCLFGAYANGSFYQLNKTTTANQFRIITRAGDVFYTFEDYALKHTYILKGNKLYIDNTEVATGSGTVDFSSQTLYLFARNYSGEAGQFGSWRIYSCKIKTNDILVRDFIPCYRNSDNEIGLYDIVNDVFYTNQGTGVFTYGSVVSIPNPDYPQEINNLSGNVEYKITGEGISESFPLSLKSKNLFDKDNANVISAYISASRKISEMAVDKLIYIPCKPNTTYSLQKMSQETANYNRFRIGTTTDMPALRMTVEDYFNAGDGSTLTNKTITTGANANYLVFYCYREDPLTTFEDMLSSIQIEEGSTATTYEPYYDIELCNISDYKDRIYSQNGEFYLEKKTVKVVLDGSETYSSFSNNRFRTPITISGGDGYRTTICICNLLKGSNQSELGTTQIENAVAINSAYAWIRITSSTTEQELKTLLQNTNAIVYYVLASSTTENITSENYPTLYSQLLAIQEFLTKYKINKEFLLDYSSPEIEY